MGERTYSDVFVAVLDEARTAWRRETFDLAIGTGDKDAEQVLSAALDRAANRGLPPVDVIGQNQRGAWLRRQLSPDLIAYRDACKRLAGRPPRE